MDLTAMQTAMLEYGKALLLWNLGQEEADASFRSLIDKMENRGIQPLQKQRYTRVMAPFYAEMEEIRKDFPIWKDRWMRQRMYGIHT